MRDLIMVRIGLVVLCMVGLNGCGSDQAAGPDATLR